MARRQGTSGKRARTRGVGEETPADPKGLKTLSEEADKTLGANGNTIAKALVDKAAKGSLACTKLLVELAERKKRRKPSAGGTPGVETLAERLAAEPEWPLGPGAARNESAAQPGKLRHRDEAGRFRKG